MKVFWRWWKKSEMILWRCQNKGRRTRREDEVCFDGLSVGGLSSSGYVSAASSPGCCCFLFVWLLIGCHPEWTAHAHTHTHKDTDTKKNILFSLSAWNLPSFSNLKKHPVLSRFHTEHWCNQNKMASEVRLCGRAVSQRKSYEQQIRAKVLDSELRSR